MFDINSTTVEVFAESGYVVVNSERYKIENFTTPSVFTGELGTLAWFPHTRFYFVNGQEIDLECTQENWDKYVQPFVDMWQIAKDAHDQEVAEANSFPVRQAKALVQLNEDFDTVSTRAYVKSSLGFTANADRIAKDNVKGLIEEVGEGTVQFCDYYNQFHELNKSQLETLNSEINKNGQNLYKQKWVYRSQIEGATDNEGLDAIVAAIDFTYMDFTPPAEEPTGDGEQAAETDQSAE